MKMKVIYVTCVPVSEKIRRDWYIDFLLAKGVTVEYWDLGCLLFGEARAGGSKTAASIHILQTYKELDEMLSLPENEDAYYVMLINYEGRFTRLYRLLSKYESRMLYIAWGYLPIRHKEIRQKVLSGLFSSPLKFAKRAFNRAKSISYRKLGLIKPFDIFFAAGRVPVESKPYAVKVVPINLVDYDHSVRLKSEVSKLVKERYVVFLDIFLPHHPDLKVVDWPAISADRYYQSLNRFFCQLEREFQVKVVVAAHPKADYKNEVFQGRDIYYGRTPELVKDADFVVSHHSTSLSYAVLNYKPILFIYTDEMKKLYIETIVSYIHDFADFLNSNIYNIDEVTQGDQIAIGGVSVERYDNYKYDFLTTHESEHTTTQEIFWREINAGC